METNTAKWWTTKVLLTLLALVTVHPVATAAGPDSSAAGLAADSAAAFGTTPADSLMPRPLAADSVAPCTADTDGADAVIAALRDSIGRLNRTLASRTAADVPAGPDSIYRERTRRYNRFWTHLVPRQFSVQFAGSIGLYSLGVGWHYGRREQWETDLLWGYVPKKHGSENHQTLTIKQRFIPWEIYLGNHRRWSFTPLTTGAFVNYIYGEGFWKSEPSRYTKGYYGFGTSVRFHVFVGQRWEYHIPRRLQRIHRSVSFYYELSTCDLYVVSAIPNRRVGLTDILSLCAGIRWDIF